MPAIAAFAMSGPNPPVSVPWPISRPAILLGQLAIDRRCQGRGCARCLIWLALTPSLRLSQQIGCFGVPAHPLNDPVRAFHRRFGFGHLPHDPRRSMIVRIIDPERSGFRTGLTG